MRFLILALFPLYAFAATTAQDCLTIQNGLDRRYCLDKHLETVKIKYENDKKNWTSGVSQEAKDSGMNELNASIAAKKDHIALLQNEMLMAEKQLETLKEASVVAATAPVAAPVEAKKKKDKRLIRFKF